VSNPQLQLNISYLKLGPVIGVAKTSITVFEARYCFIAGEALDNIVQHTEQHIFIVQHNVSRANGAKLTDEIYIKVFVVLLCLVGTLQNNKQSL
jgi:hypothetical protein